MSAYPRDTTWTTTDSHRPTRENRVSRQSPCDWCGDTTYCLRFDDGGSFCRTVGDPDQWIDAFMGGYLHRPDANEIAARPVRLTASADTAPTVEAASLDDQHTIYSDLLTRCPLSDAHHALLTGPQHGLDNEQARLYGTLPVDATARRAIIDALVTTHGTGTLLRTPGFILNESGRIALAPVAGILMPRRDLQGRLTGFQVRSDKPDADPRYLWLSSASAGGPSSGTAPHVATPVGGVRNPHEVYIVEGIKKADLLAERLGCLVISISGVGTWRAAEEVLDELATRGVDICVITLDRDVKPSAVEHVERSRQRLAAAAVARGYATRIASWDKDVAKGPDDLLIAGRTFTLERYCPPTNEPDTATPPLRGPAATATGTADQELIVVQRAALADCKAQIKAWEALHTNEPLPHKAQKVLVDFHQKFNTPLGRTLPAAMPCTLYVSEDAIKAQGLGVSAYKEGLDVLLSLGLLTREKRQKIAAATDDTDEAARMRRGRGCDYYYEWGLNGPAVNAFWQQLPTLTEIAPTERQVKAVEGRKKRLAAAIAEGRATLEVVAVLKREVAREREVCATATYERDALTYERDSAREAAEAAARERDQALESAQRIIRESQQPGAGDAGLPARLMCRAGCGSFITPAEWCCDECREREREERADLRLNVNLNSSSETLPLDVTNRLNVNFESPASVDGALKPCAGGCGTLTRQGWECKPCRSRPAADPLLRRDHAATAQEAMYGS